MNLGRFNGQTLTFKQIVDSLNVENENLIELFTSDPAGLDLDIDAYPPPISFNKFLHHAVYEPADN